VFLLSELPVCSLEETVIKIRITWVNYRDCEIMMGVRAREGIQGVGVYDCGRVIVGLVSAECVNVGRLNVGRLNVGRVIVGVIVGRVIGGA
jgi:hypothetical protein